MHGSVSAGGGRSCGQQHGTGACSCSTGVAAPAAPAQRRRSLTWGSCWGAAQPHPPRTAQGLWPGGPCPARPAAETLSFPASPRGVVGRGWAQVDRAATPWFAEWPCECERDVDVRGDAASLGSAGHSLNRADQRLGEGLGRAVGSGSITDRDGVENRSAWGDARPLRLRECVSAGPPAPQVLAASGFGAGARQPLPSGHHLSTCGSAPACELLCRLDKLVECPSSAERPGRPSVRGW